MLRKEKYPLSIDEMSPDEIMDEVKEECPFSLDPNQYFFSKQERTIYELSFLEGKKNKEISEILGISPKNVSNTKQRIIKKIKETQDKSLF